MLQRPTEVLKDVPVAIQVLIESVDLYIDVPISNITHGFFGIGLGRKKATNEWINHGNMVATWYGNESG